MRRCGAAYYLATGLWPLINMASFELITGRKRDQWLVKTVGVLVAVIGGVQLRGAAQPPDELRRLSVGVGLAAIELYYWRRGTISLVHALDALGELSLAAAWLLNGSRRPRRGARPSPMEPVPESRGPRRRPGTAHC